MLLMAWLFLGLCGREVLSDYQIQKKFLKTYNGNPLRGSKPIKELRRHTANDLMRGLVFSLLLGPLTFIFLYTADYVDKK